MQNAKICKQNRENLQNHLKKLSKYTIIEEILIENWHDYEFSDSKSCKKG
jgi:hypothetical protein